MGSYPFGDDKFHEDSDIFEDQGVEVNLSESGGVRGRFKFPGVIVTLDLVFDPLIQADFDTLRSFYDSGIGPHSITYSGVVYSNMFLVTVPRKVKNHQDSGYFRVEQRLIGTA